MFFLYMAPATKGQRFRMALDLGDTRAKLYDVHLPDVLRFEFKRRKVAEGALATLKFLFREYHLGKDWYGPLPAFQEITQFAFVERERLGYETTHASGGNRVWYGARAWYR